MPRKPQWYSRLGCGTPFSVVTRATQRARESFKVWFRVQRMRRRKAVKPRQAEVLNGPPTIRLAYPQIRYDIWKHRSRPPLERYSRGNMEYTYEGEVFARPTSMPLALNPVYERRLPLPEDSVSSRPPPPPSNGLNEAMHPSTVMAIVAWLSKSLSHEWYMVTGLSAMIMHGYTGRYAKHVAILCPDHSLEMVRCWVKTQQGVVKLESTRYEFGIRLPDDGGKIRRVKIRRILGSSWYERMRTSVTVRGDDYGENGVRILGLEALLDYTAKSYMTTRGSPGAMALQRSLAEEVTWLVHQIMRYEKVVCRKQIPHFLNPLFLDTFEGAFPDARALFLRAGLVIQDSPNPAFNSAGRPITMMTVDSGIQNYFRYNDLLQQQQRDKERANRRAKRRGEVAATKPRGRQLWPPPPPIHRAATGTKPTVHENEKPLPLIPAYKICRDPAGEVPELAASMWDAPTLKPGPLATVFREMLTPS
ncbi:hypothetical protein jhhlp_005205 [Lomentospora prolificans]|uniref:Uncharacterized protein n=1 Tax=Lomentospora prolificans TaxID=41688 RepID=A0A2N3N7A6_9PEZI|nr:hypothetical protein jhhlp_005205 [Lomentospora prolificans]